MEIGGGFGGKIRVYLEPVAALLSKKTGRPVKIADEPRRGLRRHRPDARLVHPRQDGRRQGRQAHRGRGVPGLRGRRVPRLAGRPGLHVRLRLLRHPQRPRSTATTSCVNKPATAAYRAPGATNAAFATETVVDEICEKLKIDPLEFRLKNAAKEGTRRADGPVYPRIGMVETLEAAKKHPHYTRAARQGPNRIARPRRRRRASGSTSA